MEERRRRLPRQLVGWPAWCRIGSDVDATWHECRVVDISLIGVGITVENVVTDPIGRQVVVVANTPAGASVSIRITGEAKYIHALPDGDLRIGLELADVSDLEQSILSTLSHLQVAW